LAGNYQEFSENFAGLAEVVEFRGISTESVILACPESKNKIKDIGVYILSFVKLWRTQ